MTVLAQAILTRVRTQLIDDLPTKRWSDTELLGWLSDGQRTLVSMDPTLGAVDTTLALVVGSKQLLPDGGFLLLDIQRNLGTDGETPGRVITVISRENLDRVDPDWHSSPRSSVTRHYLYDLKTPRIFFVFPPSTGDTFIDATVGMNPDDITDLAQPIVVPDLYQTALFDFVMFRAHQKDSDYAAGDQKAQGYLQLFQMFMQGHGQADQQESASAKLGDAA